MPCVEGRFTPVPAERMFSSSEPAHFDSLVFLACSGACSVVHVRAHFFSIFICVAPCLRRGGVRAINHRGGIDCRSTELFTHTYDGSFILDNIKNRWKTFKGERRRSSSSARFCRRGTGWKRKARSASWATPRSSTSPSRGPRRWRWWWETRTSWSRRSTGRICSFSAGRTTR